MDEAGALKAILPKAGQIEYGAPMRLYTTFRVGGPADILAVPYTAEQIASLVGYCRSRRLPYAVIGAGSNLLVSDRGFRGMVIRLTSRFGACRRFGAALTADAGMRLAALARQAAEFGLSGLEFAEGIPGTVGGGVVMNAGAYDGEMSAILFRAEVLDAERGTVSWLSREEMAFGPRRSAFQQRPGDIILRAKIILRPDNAARIQAKMRIFRTERSAKQPLSQPSAGSVFKRPPGFYAGTMIESLGFKGFSVGGAAVSEKHAGFIVNRGGATADDIYRLMRYIVERVEAAYSVTLEPEIRLLGDFEP
jgi:UDP-N-acetylmuramate dehydrogenase